MTTYRQLEGWKRWRSFYARLLLHSDEYTMEEMEKAINDFCRREEIDLDTFDEWATEQEIGARALKA